MPLGRWEGRVGGAAGKAAGGLETQPKVSREGSARGLELGEEGSPLRQFRHSSGLGRRLPGGAGAGGRPVESREALRDGGPQQAGLLPGTPHPLRLAAERGVCSCRRLRIAANYASCPRQRGARYGAGGGNGPRAVITAAVATARRVSASAEINWRRRRGREQGQRSTQSHNERRIDRPRGQQLAATARGCAGRWLRESGARRGPGMPRTPLGPVFHRELSQPPPLLSPQNAPHIALGSHFRPPFLGVPSALCQTPGKEWAGVHAP